MAFRELHVVEIKEVLRLWSKGKGYRTVVRATGVDRKTVRRYVRTAIKAGLRPGGEVDDEVIAAVVDEIRPGAPPAVGAMREHLRNHASLVRGWGTRVVAVRSWCG